MAKGKLDDDLAQYKLLEEQTNVLQQQIELVDDTLKNSKLSLESINLIDDINKETEVLLPIGPGIDIPVTISGKEKLVVSVGADVAVEMDAKKAATIIEGKIHELEETRKKLITTYRDASKRLDSLGASIEMQYAQQGQR